VAIGGAVPDPLATRQEVRQVALGLDLFPIPAFLTDQYNRIVRVNRTFARTVGDPVRDQVPWPMRFVPAAIVGPYRDRFPRWRDEIAQCLSGLYREVEAGNLAAGTLKLVDDTLASEDELLRAARRTTRDWDGTMVVKDPQGRSVLVREQVVPINDPTGRASGFHASLWLPAERDAVDTCDANAVGLVPSQLTPRQLEIARMFASGMTAQDVASAAGISWRTARGHLEEIYGRLDVHSRAELALVLSRAGAV
jgi:DNA-binding CsgD family transcriptional regulator